MQKVEGCLLMLMHNLLFYELVKISIEFSPTPPADPWNLCDVFRLQFKIHPQFFSDVQVGGRRFQEPQLVSLEVVHGGF